MRKVNGRLTNKTGPHATSNNPDRPTDKNDNILTKPTIKPKKTPNGGIRHQRGNGLKTIPLNGIRRKRGEYRGSQLYQESGKKNGGAPKKKVIGQEKAAKLSQNTAANDTSSGTVKGGNISKNIGKRSKC